MHTSRTAARPMRVGPALLVALALLLTSLVMASPSAEAQTGPTCVEGERVGNQCVITGAPPVAGPSVCPVDGSEVADPSECFTLVGVEVECPTGTTLDPNGVDCRRAVDLVPGALVCAAGFGLVNGECIRAIAPETVCEEGDLTGSVCLVQGAPPVQGPAQCPVSPTVFQDGDVCYTLVPQSTVCPAGSTPDPISPGFCREPVEPITDEFGGTTCPVDTIVIDIDGECFIQVEGSILCADGTFPDPDGVNCRRAVDLVPGALTCPDAGFGLVNGECVRSESPVSGCSEGTLTGENCIIIGEPPVQQPATCPVSPTVFQDGNECYTLVPTTPTCPAGTTPDPDGNGCRQPVDVVPGALTCPEPGFGLVDGECLRFVDLVYLCNGLEVTINMRTGDSRFGTSGDDVILGTGNNDVIFGRGGNDTICAGGGNDVVIAGAGSDVVFGQGGNDYIRGGTGDDLIRAGAGNDIVVGDAGDDVLRGQAGDDFLAGLRGQDRCYGGSGTDVASYGCEIIVGAP